MGFLVGDNARQVNGAAWAIDGGWTAVWWCACRWKYYSPQYSNKYQSSVNTFKASFLSYANTICFFLILSFKLPSLTYLPWVYCIFKTGMLLGSSCFSYCFGSPPIKNWNSFLICLLKSTFGSGFLSGFGTCYYFVSFWPGSLGYFVKVIFYFKGYFWEWSTSLFFYS